MGGGGGGGKTVYKAPDPDPAVSEFYKMQTAILKENQELAKAERDRLQENEIRRQQNGLDGLGGYFDTLSGQFQRGNISANTFTQQMIDYGAKYDINIDQKYIDRGNELIDAVTPIRAEASVNRAYTTLLNRDPTEDELSLAVTNLTGGIENYAYDDLKDDIVNSKEYKDEFNRSYLENYHDAYYGEQTRDEEGKRTGLRTFKYDEAFMPSFDADLAGDTGVTLPTFGDFTGSVAQLEEYTQSVRQARSFAYNAGLTNLQGNIDKELTKMKTDSAEKQKEIGGFYGLAASLGQGMFAG